MKSILITLTCLIFSANIHSQRSIDVEVGYGLSDNLNNLEQTILTSSYGLAWEFDNLMTCKSQVIIINNARTITAQGGYKLVDNRVYNAVLSSGAGLEFDRGNTVAKVHNTFSQSWKVNDLMGILANCSTVGDVIYATIGGTYEIY